MSIRRVLIALMLAASACAISSTATAGDWTFRRSYYSHDIPPELEPQVPVPASRSAYRKPIVRSTPGIAVRGGFRINRIFLRSGNSSDLTIIQEFRHEIVP